MKPTDLASMLRIWNLTTAAQMGLLAPKPIQCLTCGPRTNLVTEGDGWGVSVYCSGCYDCDHDERGFFSTNIVGTGATEAEALASWVEQVEDAS